MVEYFGEQLSGFAFTANGWVQSYGSRCVKPPIIYGDVSRPKPMTVFWSSTAQSLTKRPMKGMLTGPITIACKDILLRVLSMTIALLQSSKNKNKTILPQFNQMCKINQKNKIAHKFFIHKQNHILKSLTYKSRKDDLGEERTKSFMKTLLEIQSIRIFNMSTLSHMDDLIGSFSTHLVLAITGCE